jgi:translation initiation factor 1
MGKRDASPEPPKATPFNSPFAGLASRLPAVTPTSPPPAAAASPVRAEPAAPPSAPPPKPGPARAVVRMERAGRGGRTVTVVEKLALPPRQLEGWCGELKRAMGCGGVVEGDAIVIQGDARERIGAWLTARGVRKVTLG